MRNITNKFPEFHCYNPKSSNYKNIIIKYINTDIHIKSEIRSHVLLLFCENWFNLIV